MVWVDVEFFNCFDEYRVSDGHLKPEQVRQTTVKALVDTGAILVSIPEAEITKLDLIAVREDIGKDANGHESIRQVFGPVRISVMGRQNHVLVMASHPGEPAVLGKLALAGLDLVVDREYQNLLPGHPEYPNEQLIEMY